MEFRILGPLEVLEDGRALELGGLKQRALLAMLLLEPNRVVSADRLIDALWDEGPPETAHKALQVYVSQLRKLLGKERLETRPPGYVLRVAEDELDLDHVRRLVDEGEFEAALALWRGPPLADFAYNEFAQGEIARLEELRLVCVEGQVDAELARGRHSALVGELEALVREHPLRERLRAQLMLAFYRSGRQAEALEAYQDARRALTEELGIDPGRELRDLHQQILKQDPALDLPSKGPPAPPAPSRPESQPSAEQRKVVTVLFADLVGFTRRSEDLDPEDVRAILDVWYKRVRPLLEQHGASVEKFIGDAVMALFGAPVTHGDDPERAVRAALAVREAVAELNRADPDLDLEFRIGINTGEALVSAQQDMGMAAGDVVNTAARLETAAPTNGILVGKETYLATRTTIRYEKVEPVAAKGKRRPLEAWAAVEAVSAQPERPLVAVAIVGRDSELDLLQRAWGRVVADRRPHLVTVLAPPGIGKTRLAAEFVQWIEGKESRIVQGRSVPYGETGGQGPFARQVKQLAGIFESDSAPAAREKLERTLAALAGPEQAEEMASPLAVLVGLETIEVGADREVSFYAARRLVEMLAAERPAVFVFEDLHWADRGDLDLVEYLASRVRDVPVLFLVLARPDLLELRPGWGGGLPASTGMSLEPLGAEESRVLAARLLEQRGNTLEQGVVDRLVQTAEGNPLFIEELVASLAERASGEAADLPTNVRGLIASRIDALPAAERSTLLDASVLGKSFWRGAIRDFGGVDDLSEILDSLEERDLIRRQPVSRIQGDHEFMFKHVLIREVAYSTLPRAARRERHAAAATFIEEAAGDRAGEWAPILAHHWREAGEPERELRWLLTAAERAWPRDAIALYDRALELIPRDDGERRRGPRLAGALARVHASEFQAAADELDELLPEVEGRERFEALRARARAAFWIGDMDRARACGDEAQSLADELGDAQLQAVILAFFSVLRSWEGELEEAVDLNERSLALWTPGSHRHELAEAHTWLSLESYWLGRYGVSLDHARRAREVGREANSAELAESAAEVGLALTGLGRHEEALAVFEEGASLAHELGTAPRWRARLLNMWAGTLRELGDVNEARRLNGEAVDLAAAAEFPPGVASGKVDLLFADLAVGEPGRAESHWPELWRTAVETDGWHAWLWRVRLSAAKAQIELAKGLPQSAAEAALDALGLAESYGRVKYAIASRLVLGSALLQLRQHEEGVQAFRRALAEAELLTHPPSIIQAAASLGNALAVVVDDEGAEATFRRAKEAVESFAAGLSAQRRDLFLQASPAADVLAAR